MEPSLNTPHGQNAAEHAAIAAHYERAVPAMHGIFGEIPLFWATAAFGLDAPPVYHRDLVDGPATIPAIAFRSPSGELRHAPVLSTHNCEWLVRGRFAVELGSWTPPPNAPQAAAFGRIHLTPSGHAGLDALAQAALDVRAALHEHGLDAVPVYDGLATMTLWIPLAGAPPMAAVYAWLKQFCAGVAAGRPERLTVAHLRADRGDRVYLGTHSNGVGEIALLPYGLSCASYLPVQWPLLWSEVGPSPTAVTAADFAAAFAKRPATFAESSATIGPQRLPSGAPIAQFTAVSDATPAPPHGYLTAAAITILSDGKTRTVDEILAEGIAEKVFPENLPRKYVYTALHEYITRALGVGGFPEFVQVDDTHFRINRPADDWPAVVLPPHDDWIDDGARTALIARLQATAVGEDPVAFEIAVCDAFAMLGFVAKHVGGEGQPDGILDAPLGAQGYRVMLECKTAHAGAPVSNPRPEEPAAFRDRGGGQYALLIGPMFRTETTFYQELQTHRAALWTVENLTGALQAALGPDELLPAFAPGPATKAFESMLWERDHGRPKRVAVLAEYLARCGWQAQSQIGMDIAATDRPRLTRDVLMLLVDQALAQSGAAISATSAEFDAALVLAETQGRIRRVGDSAEDGWVVRYPQRA